MPRGGGTHGDGKLPVVRVGHVLGGRRRWAVPCELDGRDHAVRLCRRQARSGGANERRGGDVHRDGVPGGGVWATGEFDADVSKAMGNDGLQTYIVLGNYAFLFYLGGCRFDNARSCDAFKKQA